MSDSNKESAYVLDAHGVGGCSIAYGEEEADTIRYGEYKLSMKSVVVSIISIGDVGSHALTSESSDIKIDGG
jgi:hypothetical protein